MSPRGEEALAKVPKVTLLFRILKIAATTLGETGGDAVSMSMNLGYLVGPASSRSSSSSRWWCGRLARASRRRSTGPCR